MKNKPGFKRVLLKLSGEILMGSQKFGLQQEACQTIALALQQMHASGLEVAVVIGGGNIFRGIHLNAMGMQTDSCRPHGHASYLDQWHRPSTSPGFVRLPCQSNERFGMP